MDRYVYNVVRALSGQSVGPVCRRCDEHISGTDQFGRSERVCSPCRST